MVSVYRYFFGSFLINSASSVKIGDALPCFLFSLASLMAFIKSWFGVSSRALNVIAFVLTNSLSKRVTTELKLSLSSLAVFCASFFTSGSVFIKIDALFIYQKYIAFIYFVK